MPAITFAADQVGQSVLTRAIGEAVGQARQGRGVASVLPAASIRPADTIRPAPRADGVATSGRIVTVA